MDVTFANPSPRRFLVGYGMGLAFGVAVTLGAVCLFALIMTVGVIPDGIAEVFAMVAPWMGSFSCGFLALLKIRCNGLVHGACVGVLLFLVYGLVCLLCAGGVSPWLILRGLGMVLFSVGGGVCAVNLVR